MITEPSGAAGQRRFSIPAKARLIIVDAHDTVLKRDLSRDLDHPFVDPRGREAIEWVLRDGFLNFLDYFVASRGKRVVVSSDGNATKLHEILERFGAAHRISHIYGREHLDPESYLKRLDQILADLEVAADEAVFIGDGRIDELSAQRYGVRFIRVPGTLDDVRFSFNAFVDRDPEDPHALRLQRIDNPRALFYNTATPELVEAIVARGEGRLAHLGPIVCPPADRHTSGTQSTVERLVVREPSSERRVHEGLYRFTTPDVFRTLHLRLLAFLQDRELFIQDCYVSAENARRMPLRIVTEQAKHALFARHNFIQMRPGEQERFVPEFTLIHVPTFRAIPELDGTRGRAFALLHPARKLALVGGTDENHELRRSVYDLISFFLVQEDVLPLVAATGALPDGRSLVALGAEPFVSINTILGTSAALVGEAHHGWTETDLFNLEWGCRIPVDPIERESTPELFETLRRFAVLVENGRLDGRRRLAPARNDEKVEAFFPIPHVRGARRSGTAGPPAIVLLLIEDKSGRLPPVSALTSSQLAGLFLLGWEDPASRERPGPCFGLAPGLLDPLSYALVFYQKLVASGARCFLLNSARSRTRTEHPLVRLRQDANGIVTGSANPPFLADQGDLSELFREWTDALVAWGGMLEPAMADAFLAQTGSARSEHGGTN